MVPPPIPDRHSVRKPFLVRLECFLRLWSLKATVAFYVLILKYVRRQPISKQPSYTKRYPHHVGGATRVFIPNSYKPGDAPLPLIIDIHGGGFAIGEPILDDRDNSQLAHKHNFVVVSIAYRKAPLNPFPGTVNDVVAQIKDVLADPDLPVDKNKVIVTGYSAGANLSLAAAQVDGLYKRIKAVVAHYPATDFAQQADQRRANAVPHPDGRLDMLSSSSNWFTWGYVSPNTWLGDPLLSVGFADREKLPPAVYLLGCEYDMLCPEARTFADRIGKEEAEAKKVERRVVDDKESVGWECGGIKWREIKGAEHGFNQVAAQRTGEERAMYLRKQEDMHDNVAEWLRRVALQ